MSIGVHILGPGYGESIVLQLPDGQIGVIDCFRDAFCRSVLPEFIRQKFQVDSLLFVAVTHPHADHCLGIRELLEEFEVGELWAFDSIQLHELRDYYHKLAQRRNPDDVEADLQIAEGTVLHELLEIRKEIAERRRKRPKKTVRLLRSKESFSICNGLVKVVGLTPGNGPTVDYRERLSRGIKTSVAASISGEDAIASMVNQNLASGALLIEYGHSTESMTRLLFLADAEEPLWQEWIKDSQEAETIQVQNVKFVKVAHHGSRNGYSAKLLKDACSGGDTVAVVTPFNRHRSPLPSQDGIKELALHFSEIICTNRNAAQRASGYTWIEDKESISGVPPVPAHWFAALLEKPQLAWLFAPYNTRVSDSKDLTIPVKWIQDCIRRPELWQLLSPQIGADSHTEHLLSPHAEFLVSVYFDDSGQEIRAQRYVGWGCGTLEQMPVNAGI